MVDFITSFIAAQSDPAATAISVFLHYDTYYLLGALYLGVLLLRPKRRTRLASLLVGLVILLAAVAVLKDAYSVARPCLNAKVPCGPSDPEFLQSFPSGHTSVAFFFAAAAVGAPEFALFYPLAIVIALSRIYLGVHSFNDVAGGVVVGITSYALGELVGSRLGTALRRLRK